MTREEREMDLWTRTYTACGVGMPTDLAKDLADGALAAFREAFPANTCELGRLAAEPKHATDARAGIAGCVDHLNPPKVPRPL